MDSLPWPGHQPKSPPAWMLEDERPAAATATVPKPSPLSAYEQEWNTLRPQVQNPWHTLDEQDQKLLIEPLDSHHKSILNPAKPPLHPAPAGLPLATPPGPDSLPRLAPGLQDLRPDHLPGLGGSGKPEHLFPTPDKTFPGPGLRESPSPQPVGSQPNQAQPLLPQLDEETGRTSSRSEARKQNLTRAKQEFHHSIQDLQKQRERPPGPLLAASSSTSPAQPQPQPQPNDPSPPGQHRAQRLLPEALTAEVQVFTDIGHYLKSGGQTSPELKRAYVEGTPFTDPRTGRPAILAASVRHIRPEELEAITAEPAFAHLAQNPRALGIEWLSRISQTRPHLLQKSGTLPRLMVDVMQKAAEQSGGRLSSGDPASTEAQLVSQPLDQDMEGAQAVLASASADHDSQEPAPQKPVSQPERASLPTPLAIPQIPPEQPRLEWHMHREPGREEQEQRLRVAGTWRVEDLPAFLQDPMLKDISPEQRQHLLNDVLRQAGAELANRPGYSHKDFRDYKAVAEAARERVADMATWGEKIKGAGGVVADVGKSALQSAVATVADSTVFEPDAFFEFDKPLEFRVPLGNVGEQAGFWMDKAGDSAEDMWAGDADKELDGGLSELEKDLASGNVPLGDRAAFDTWLDNYASRLSDSQAAWYEAVQGTGEKFTHNGKEQVMDKAWLQAYSKANGLNAPHNAALLAEYLNTRDPQALKQLTESLKKTPRRAAIERDQQAALDKSQVVTFLSGLTGVDYRQIMMDAGNPLEIASNFIPPLRGARAASKVGGGLRRTITSAAGSVAADLALESVNQAVENPHATLDDYLANGRNTVAAALGMHTAGAAAAKAAQRLAPNSPPPAPTDRPPAPPTPDAPAPAQPQPPPGQPPLEYETAPSEYNPQIHPEGEPGPPGNRQTSPGQPGAALPNPPPPNLDQVHADAVSQGIIPPIQQQGDKFIITDQEGTPAFYDSRQEAVQDSFLFMTPQQRQKVQAMVEQKQKAAVQKTAPAKKQAVTATVGGDPPQNLDGDTGQAEAETSASTTETGTAPAQASMPQANPQTAPKGPIPPAQPSQPANTPPPLWQGSIGRDSQGQDKKVVIRQRNTDGSYQVQTPEGQSIRLTPEAYESMTGAKPEPTTTAPDPAGKPSDEAESGPLWHVPIRDTHALPKLPYNSAHKPNGPRKVMSKKNTNPDNIRATNGENEAADVMARYGYQIEQIKESDKSPDLKINDMPDKADVYSPASASSLKNIRSTIRGKVEGQNAPYVVILLQPGDNSQSIKDLTEFMKKNPVNGLKQLFVVKEGKLYTLQ